MTSIKKQAISGIIWTGLQLIVNQSFGMIVRLVLAKVLFPEQFGLIGMATVFIGFVQVFNDLGIGAALIQRKNEDLHESHFHTAFWAGVFWAILMYLIISFILAPFAADFYNELILKKLIPVLGLGILSSPINLVHKAQLTKSMNFKKMAFIDNISSVSIGILSVLLAFNGAGVWSLAFNSIGSIIIAMPLYFNATKWKPKFIFEKYAFKDVFGFGIYTTGTNILNYLINNIDYLIIGKLLSAQILGIYTFAFMLTDVFKSRLTAVISKVMYPLYSKVQSDRESVKKIYIKVVEYNCLLVYPFMLYLIILGKPFILTIFGDKWIEALAPMQILASAVMIQMLVYSNTVLIRGMGRPDFELKLQFIKALIYVPMIIFGIYYGGIIGGSFAVLINRIIAVFITNYTFRVINIKIKFSDFSAMIKAPFICVMISSFFTIIFYQYFDMNFIVSSFSMILSYFISFYLIKKNEILLLFKDSISIVRNK